MYMVNSAVVSACQSQQFHNELKMYRITLLFPQTVCCCVNYNIRNCYLDGKILLPLHLTLYMVWQKILQNPLVIPKIMFLKKMGVEGMN